MKPKFKAFESLDRLSRRSLFKGTGFAALTGLAGCNKPPAQAPVAPKYRIPITTYTSIGVNHVINCMGTMTHLGGSLMPPEVVAAMVAASKNFIPIRELQAAAGKRLSELQGVESGCVTSGAAAAMFAGTCACVTGGDSEKLALIPDTKDMKNECIVSKAHRTPFDRAIRMVGVKMVEVDSKEEMEKAFNDKTAMIFVWGEISLPNHPAGGNIQLTDICELGNKHGVPILVDAAAERPDAPNRYTEAGCDLVCYSGGKCLAGPNDTGLLLGRKDLVEAAVRSIAPYGGMGRAMKVGKECIMGVLTAVDLWVNVRDHEAEWKEWEKRLEYMSEKIEQVPTVKTEVIPPGRLCNYTPSMFVTWDQNTIKLTPRELMQKLAEGEPRVLVDLRKGDEFRSRGEWVSICPFMMQPGQEIIAAEKFIKVLTGA